jgi:hypothetical protein
MGTTQGPQQLNKWPRGLGKTQEPQQLFEDPRSVSSEPTQPPPERNLLGGKNKLAGKTMGRHPPAQKTAKMFNLVGEKCLPSNLLTHKGGYPTTLEKSPKCPRIQNPGGAWTCTRHKKYYWITKIRVQ